MKNLSYLLIVCLFAACANAGKNKEKYQSQKEEDQPKNHDKKTEIPVFKILNTSSYEASKLEHDGKIIHQKTWQDANGENIVIFTKRIEELFVYHYLIHADTPKLLRRVYDLTEKNCEYDLFAEFIQKSIGVTDMDNNNLGEITFAYKLACISDASPLTLKLLILENGNKYIIRGTTKVDLGPEYRIESTKSIDPSFDKAPKSFLLHAKKTWKDIEKG